MGYTLHIDHTAVNFTSGNLGRRYIVIHYTGNATDTAAGNANYFRSNYRGASAHYFVDTANVYEVVSPNDTAWAVGVDYGNGQDLFSVCKNWNSINIEMCSVNGRIPQATIDNTVELTKSLMKRYGIPASHVVRHWDVCRKRCPGWAGWLPGDEHIWNSFKAALTQAAVAPKPAPQGVKVAVAYGVFRLYNPNNGDHIFTADAKEVYKVTMAGWKYEGCAMRWPEKGDVDVYRLYNPNAGDHLFTTSEAERKNLVAAGWKYEGKAFRASSKAGTGLKPVYRLYDKNSGRHILTISESEHNTLSGLGWHCEGIVFYLRENGDRG